VAEIQVSCFVSYANDNCFHLTTAVVLQDPGQGLKPDMQPPQPTVTPAPLFTPLRRIAVSDLMAGAKVVILMHDAQEYRLRLTQANKLILTK
jgi:hemin uptake protein HemP